MADRQYLGGVTDTVLHWETDGSVTIEERQDAQPILDHAERLRNGRFSAETACEGLLRHEAEIPVVVYLAECRRIGAQPFTRAADVAIDNLLNDPLYARLRVQPKLTDPHVIVKGAR